MGSTDLAMAPNMLQSGSYSAQRLRQMVTAFPDCLEGVVGLTEFSVTQRGAGANMSVDIGAGDAYVQGDAITRQGLYHVRNDATANVAVTAADATNPRIDRVVLTIKDDAHDAGGLNVARLQTIDGTPTSGATLANLNGAAAVPASSLLLANIVVAAADTSITTGEIGDQRVFVTKGARVYNNANITLTTGVNTTLTFNSERFDLDNMHSLTSNTGRITFNTAGFYSVFGGVAFAANATGNRHLYIQLNGSTPLTIATQTAVGGAADHHMNVGGVYQFSAADYIELIAFQSSGGNLNVLAAGNSSPEFQAFRIG